MGKIAHKDADDMSVAEKVSKAEWKAAATHLIDGVANIGVLSETAASSGIYDLGSYLIKGTSVAIKDAGSEILAVKDDTDAAYAHIYCAWLKPFSGIDMTTLPINFGSAQEMKVTGGLFTTGQTHFTLQASVGTDAFTHLRVVPLGAGIGGGVDMAEISIFNTDYAADIVNFERIFFESNGTLYSITTEAGGTGTVRPIVFWIAPNQTADESCRMNADGTWTWTKNVTFNGNLTVNPSSTVSIKLDDLATPDDNTDLDVSTSLHGLVPKGTNLGKFLKDDGSWATAGGAAGTAPPRTVTYVVAADDNAQHIKDQADYVCNGTNDEVTIETALGLAGARGLVSLCPAGTYNIDATLDLDEGAVLDLNGATLAITGDDYNGIYIQSSANFVIGDAINGKVTTTALYAKSAVKVQPQHNIWGYNGLLSNLWVQSASKEDVTAGSVGIEIVCSADNTGDNRYINFASFGPAFIEGFEKGARIYIYRRTSGSAYFNDNTLNFQIENSAHLFDIEIDGDTTEPYHACQANDITLKLQPEWGDSKTATGIRLISTIDERIIKNRFKVSGWDWTHATGAFITCSAYSEWNRFSGKLLFMHDLLACASYIIDNNGTNSFYDENQDVMLGGQSDQFTYHGVGIDAWVVQGTVAADYAWGDVCYLSTATGKWTIADADAVATARDALGILISEPTAADQTVLILRRGHLDYGGWAWSKGDELFLSTTAGDVTATAPSGAGDIIRHLGYGVEDDVMYFNPSSDYFEHDGTGINKINGIVINV